MDKFLVKPASSSPAPAAAKPTKKRALDKDDIDFQPPAPKKRAPAKKAKTAAIPGHCSLNKKDFGDRIKECLRLEKYDIQRMMFSMKMDVTFFRAFFDGEVKTGVSITPAEYDETTPVIVAQLSNEAAGRIFGVSKIKNGNRMASFDLSKMVVILYPVKEAAQAWVSV